MSQLSRFHFQCACLDWNVLIDRNEQQNEGEKQKNLKNKIIKRLFIWGKKTLNIYMTNFVNLFHSPSPLKCVNTKKTHFPNKKTPSLLWKDSECRERLALDVHPFWSDNVHGNGLLGRDTFLKINWKLEFERHKRIILSNLFSGH